MLIRFGLHRDGLDPTAPRTAVGEVTLGPQGFIRVLESDLGLAPVLEHPAEQLMAYRACLADANDLTRFYHRSFGVDPINVTRTLLDWRAQWYAAGWDGTFPAHASARLRDLADVEALAAPRVPLTIGQRLRRIAAALTRRHTQIDRVVLLDAPDELPSAWRAVLERLAWEVDTGVEPRPQGAPGTDLHRVQTALAALDGAPDGARPAPIGLSGDGSFLVVRGVSRDISAQAVAEALRAAADPSATVVLAERDGIILDNAFERAGMPRCGFQHYSRFRAVSQVLKLCLALLWEPLSPHLLLQFLIHPLGPVDGRIRRVLAEVVAAEPGIGGRAWRKAVAALSARDDLEASRVQAAVAYWFETPRFAVAAAPVEALTERAQRCASWLASRLATNDEKGDEILFRAAYAQAEALIAALRRLADLGQHQIGKIELDRLLDEVTREQPDPTAFATAGRVRAATDPAALTDPYPQVVWWDLAPTVPDLGYPWSRAELDELAAAGLELPTVETQLAARGRRWRRPIMNARQRFVLVVHATDEGQHPLVSQLASRFTGWAEVDVDWLLLNGAADILPQLAVSTATVPVRPLTTPRRWWQLPATVALGARDVESYSSLAKLFFHPHEWVLTYPGALKKGRADDLADGPLLYGNVAHRLLEEFFSDHPGWRNLAPPHVDEWLARTLPALIRREAAVLLEPGRGVDRQQVGATLERALGRLLEHLRAAGIETVRVEVEETQPYLDGHLRGAIDLLLTDAAGREIVVDAKWGGENPRVEEIAANRHLQLATYAYMRKTATGANRWPYVAYFIVTTGNLLAPDHTVFPDAVVRRPADNESLAELWARGEATYRWRRRQLGDGAIEVNAVGTAPTERSHAPDDALETDRDPDRFDDFTRLTGWSTFE